MRRSTFWFFVLGGLAIIILGSMLALSGERYVLAQDSDEGGGDYIGAGECSSCHRGLARDHTDSRHALTLQNVKEDTAPILGDFDAGRELRTVRFPGEEDARPFTTDDIAFTLGSGLNVQAYLYEVDQGKYMVFPAQWSVADEEWQPLDLADAWPDSAYEFGPNCAGCHTIGLETEEYNWIDDGVQCEACHGPGRDHVETVEEVGNRPSDAQLQEIRDAIVLSADAQICGQCHIRGETPEGTHPYPVDYVPGSDLLGESVFIPVPSDVETHWWATGHAKQPNMQFNEWLNSTHANAAESVRESEIADDTCLECHSMDFRLTETLRALYEEGILEGEPPATVTAETAQYGVTCIACHDPHSENDIDTLLVAEVYTLCTDCHSNAAVGDLGVHHPAQELFEGVGLVQSVDGTPSGHFLAGNGPECITCHMPDVPVGYQDRSSHTFDSILPGEAMNIEELQDACTACHVEFVDAGQIQQFIDDSRSGMQSRLDAIRGALKETSPEWVKAAAAFVEGDGSSGIHNYPYANDLLTAAEIELGLVTIGEPGEIVGSTEEIVTEVKSVVDTGEIVAGLTLPLLILGAIGLAMLLMGAVLLLSRFKLFGVVSVIVAVVLIGGVIFARQRGPTFEVTGRDDYCLLCHADTERLYDFRDDTTIDLEVDLVALANSVHGIQNDAGVFGCVDCHGAGYFPHDPVPFASRASYRVEQSNICLDCHKDDADHYIRVLERNIRVGCTDCHTAHEVTSVEELLSSGAQPIFERE